MLLSSALIWLRSRPRLTQPCSHTIYPGVSKIYQVFVVSADITIAGKLFHIFTILDAI